MAWETPKTDWQATDYFNYRDYSRIVGNIAYLKTLHDKVFASVELENVPSSKSYTSIMYASEMNAIENNLESLNLASYRLDIGAKASYKINGATPLWSEFNRIESACLRLYKTYNAHINNIPRLAFRLGNDKTFCCPRA